MRNNLTCFQVFERSQDAKMEYCKWSLCIFVYVLTLPFCLLCARLDLVCIMNRSAQRSAERCAALHTIKNSQKMKPAELGVLSKKVSYCSRTAQSIADLSQTHRKESKNHGPNIIESKDLLKNITRDENNNNVHMHNARLPELETNSERKRI